MLRKGLDCASSYLQTVVAHDWLACRSVLVLQCTGMKS